jgi:flagellar protein FliS
MNNPYQKYIQNEPLPEKKEEILIETYKEILSKLNMLKIAISEKSIKEKTLIIDKLLVGLEILRKSLDFENGKEIAKNLDSIYGFCIEELLKANISDKIEYVQNVIDVITPIKEGFEEAYKSIKNGKAS